MNERMKVWLVEFSNGERVLVMASDKDIQKFLH